MKKVYFKILTPLAVFVLWSVGLYRWTGGFTSFTTYSYALYNAGKIPRPVTNLLMKDFNGRSVEFSRWKGNYLLVDFMYLHCSSVCGILRSRLYEFYPVLKDHLDKNLMFVSISFDPERDTPEILKESWQSLGAKDSWMFASLQGSFAKISDQLKSFGVVRIPQPNGDFNHTSMFFLIDPSGNLIAIIDPSRGKEKNIEEIIKKISG